MKNKDSVKATVSATLCLLLICFICTFAVAGTNEAFKDQIEAQEWASTQESMSKLLDAENYEVFTAEDKSDAYKAIDSNGDIIGYIFITEAPGYGSAISVMTAISEGEVVAIDILDCSDETPGLGQNITKEDFLTQFSGLTQGPEVIKSGSAGENEIDSLTGATKSSRGVANAVAAAFELYEAAIG